MSLLCKYKIIAPSRVKMISSIFYKFIHTHYWKSASSIWRVRVYGVERVKNPHLKNISHVSLAICHAITFILHKLVVILLCHSRLLTGVTIYLTFYNDFDSAYKHLRISICLMRKYYIAFHRQIKTKKQILHKIKRSIQANVLLLY